MKLIAVVLITLVIFFSGCITQDVVSKKIKDEASLITKKAAETTGKVVEKLMKRIDIDIAIDRTIVIRNTGATDINATELSVSIDNVVKYCKWDKASVAPGELIVAYCSCTSGQIVEVAAPGNRDSAECK